MPRWQQAHSKKREETRGDKKEKRLYHKDPNKRSGSGYHAQQEEEKQKGAGLSQEVQAGKAESAIWFLWGRASG